MSRFIVGIDLGTTNSVVAFVDTHAGEDAPVQVMEIPQLTAPGTIEARTMLPSFLYLPAEGEFPAHSLTLPWSDDETHVSGALARQRGAEVPSRVIASAKSWLSHSGADRTGPILPWGAPEDVPRMSPVEVSVLFLEHVRSAWNHTHPDAPLEEQDVLLTVPASFDAVARDLTMRAATEAGLAHVTLLEEPQAAFYAWIDTHGDEWREAVGVGDVILVCDLGGGTTDFSLIAVREEEGALSLERVAVGDHILLGGDNMDLTLAYAVSQRLAAEGNKLDAWQLRGLTHSCREAKEKLLSHPEDDKHPVAILGRGRKLIGGTLRTDVARAEVDSTLVEGFFPACAANEKPRAQQRTALQEIGLPYATDPAVTRHLAHFIDRHQDAIPPREDGSRHPTAVLFNGGVTRAGQLCDRLVEVTSSWYRDVLPGGLRVLGGADPEHAVARGAAYYGLARRGRGVRIRGGTARSYYVGIESAMPAVPGMRPPIKALCVVPQGIEEGSDIDMPGKEFGLVLGEPTQFRFLTSSTRRDDQVGELVEDWEDDIEELAPLESVLEWEGQEGTMVPVHLQARVTEVGVLELWCVHRDGEHRWKLEFNTRVRE